MAPRAAAAGFLTRETATRRAPESAYGQAPAEDTRIKALVIIKTFAAHMTRRHTR
jgi:hypothetical protein